jgi:hypothetical protein
MLLNLLSTIKGQRMDGLSPPNPSQSHLLRIPPTVSWRRDCAAQPGAMAGSAADPRSRRLRRAPESEEAPLDDGQYRSLKEHFELTSLSVQILDPLGKISLWARCQYPPPATGSRVGAS